MIEGKQRHLAPSLVNWTTSEDVFQKIAKPAGIFVTLTTDKYLGKLETSWARCAGSDNLEGVAVSEAAICSQLLGVRQFFRCFLNKHTGGAKNGRSHDLTYFVWRDSPFLVVPMVWPQEPVLVWRMQRALHRWAQSAYGYLRLATKSHTNGLPILREGKRSCRTVGFKRCGKSLWSNNIFIPAGILRSRRKFSPLIHNWIRWSAVTHLSGSVSVKAKLTLVSRN